MQLTALLKVELQDTSSAPRTLILLRLFKRAHANCPVLDTLLDSTPAAQLPDVFDFIKQWKKECDRSRVIATNAAAVNVARYGRGLTNNAPLLKESNIKYNLNDGPCFEDQSKWIERIFGVIPM